MNSFLATRGTLQQRCLNVYSHHYRYSGAVDRGFHTRQPTFLSTSAAARSTDRLSVIDDGRRSRQSQ
nr:hypothetical protein JVH1_4317 [Rhodococcus sp. JVH1]